MKAYIKYIDFCLPDKVLTNSDIVEQFPEWTVDQTLADKLAQTVEKIKPEICLPGHWTPLSPEVIIQDLLEGNG